MKFHEDKMEEYQTAHKISRKPRTGDVMITENVDFAALLLSKPVLEGLSKCGFEKPSPIQLKSIPLGRCGLDLVVQAKSGTGKTCVFTVIALESLILPSNSIQVLVLAPTREIAVQIQQVITAVGCGIRKLQCHTFIGGTPLTEDKEKLRRCHIAVGTPGRLKQLIEEKLLRTDSIRLFVMDEADKLMEKSFQDQINWIYWTLPDNKQMLVLSATYPEDVAKLVTQYMRNPTLCRLNASDPALMGIHQYYQTVEFHPLPQKMFDVKLAALMKILSSVTFQQCLIFSNYQLRAQSLSDMLSAQGWPATFISGSQDQQHRLQAMEKLKKLHCRVLVTTDLTSRGIDAEHVNLVINLDVPYDHETYLHRIGRAGRFGTYGAAISLVAGGKEYADLKTVEQKCHTRIKILPDPMREDLLSQPPDEDMFTFVEELKLDQISNKSIQQDSMNSVQSRGKLESEQQDSMNSVRSRGKLESKQLDRHLGLENNASIFVQSDCNGKTEKDYINGDTSVGEVNPAIADIFDDKIAQNEDIGEDEIKLFKRNDLEKVLQEEKGVKVSNSGSDHIASKEQETQPYSLNTNEPVSRSKKNKRARNKPKNQAVGEDIYQNISTVSSNKFQSSLGVDDLGHNDESGKVESTANKEHFSKDQIDKKDSDKFNIYKVLTRNWSSASRKDVSFEVIAKDHDRFMNNPEKWEKTRGFGIQKTELTESVNVSGEELADGMAGLLQKLHVGPVEHGEDYHTAMESVLRREKTLTNNISKTLTSRKMNSDYTMDDVQSLLDSYENIAMDGSKIMTKPLTLMYSKLENEDDMSDGDEECSDSDVSEGVTSSTAISDSCSESDSDEELEAGFIHKGSAIQYCDQGAPPEENQIEPPGGGEPYYDEYDQSYLFYQEQDKKHQLAFDNDHGDSSYSKDEYITHYAQTNAVYKDEYSPANYQHEWEHDPFYVEEYLENDLAGDHLKDGHTSEHSEGKQYHKKQRKQKKISHSANRHEANSNTNSYWWYNNMAYSANQNGVGKQNIDLKPGSSGRNYVVDSGNEQETYKANEGYFPSFDWWNSYMAHNWMMQYQLTNQMQLCYQNYMTHYQWALYYENMLKNYKRHEKLSDSYKQQKEYIAQMSKWITKNKQV